jgi:hypothetical protein
MQVEQEAMAIARGIAERYCREYGSGLIDGRGMVKVALAGYLAGSGVPTDEAVHLVEELVARMMVSPIPPNPMYHGLPWMVPGPVSGAPYYTDR